MDGTLVISTTGKVPVTPPAPVAAPPNIGLLVGMPILVICLVSAGAIVLVFFLVRRARRANPFSTYELFELETSTEKFLTGIELEGLLGGGNFGYFPSFFVYSERKFFV